MKKLMGMILAVVMMVGAVPAFASENLEVKEGCTYKVTVNESAEVGSVMVVDNDYNTESFVTVVGADYGYIYIPTDANLTVDVHNVNFELVAEEDLGISGTQVYVFDNYRSYDPVVDSDYLVCEGTDADF